ncbi:MAG: hypothetical protein AB9880_07995 [Christensenellales bacterium]
MKKDSTELVFILDKSGSMSGLESDTIGGFNGMLLKQRAVAGSCRITTALFDHNWYLLHDRLDIQAVAPLDRKDYAPGGNTALFDAVGRTIHKIGEAQKHTAEAYRAEKVLVVIITDGMENASQFFSLAKVRALIGRQKEKYGWEFIFLGANIDAAEVAGGFGINPDRAQDYHADSQGVDVNFCALSRAVESFRVNDAVPVDWSEEIHHDYTSRGGQH